MRYQFANRQMRKYPTVYIMASKRNGTFYTGVMSNIIRRIYKHRNNIIKGVTSKYNCKLFVYYEFHNTILDVISREKQIQAGSRAKKLKLIEDFNPHWEDLFTGICW